MFNLAVPDDVLQGIMKLADFDGDGSVNFAEFARIMTADDILNLKQTLTADVTAHGHTLCTICPRRAPCPSVVC